MAKKLKQIAFFQTKGGEGKSSSALLYYGFLQQSGYAMGFKDLDPQGTRTAGMNALGWEKDSDPDYLILDYPSKVQTVQT